MRQTLNERITLNSSMVELADMKTHKLATFLISVLDEPDRVGRIIPYDVGVASHETIIGFPIVAKLVCDEDGNPVDFKGHEMYIIRSEDGVEEARFGTQPIGSVVASWIEEREVEGYVGKKQCIMIQAKIWSTRYPEYCAVLDKLWAENKVQSSWELVASSSIQTVKGKILQAISFIGNAILGTGHIGAVPGAGVYEYAALEENPEYLLAAALSKDLAHHTEEGVNPMEHNEPILEPVVTTVAEPVQEEPVVAEPVVDPVVEEPMAEPTEPVVDPTVAETDPVEEPTIDAAALTEEDLRRRITEAYRAEKNGWGWIAWHFPMDKTVWMEPEVREDLLTYDLVTYDVQDDVVTITNIAPVKLSVSIAEVNEQIASRDAALVSANDKIRDLESQISELLPYKARCEAEDLEKAEAEREQQRTALAEYAVRSGLIQQAEIDAEGDVRTMVQELNEAGIKSLIAERFMNSLDAKPAVAEVAAVSAPAVASVNLQDGADDTEVSNDDFMKHILTF